MSINRNLGDHFFRTFFDINPLPHFIFDDSQTTKAHIEVSFNGNKNLLIEGTTVEWKRHSYFKNWKNTIRNSIKNYDAIIAENWYTVKYIKNNIDVKEKKILEWTGKYTPVPVFGTIPHSVGPERLVRAMVLTGRDHGRDAAIMTLKILDENKKPNQISIRTTVAGKYLFNIQNLRKYNIKLPIEIKKRTHFQ